MPSHDVPQLEARHLVEASSLEAANYRWATLRCSAATCRANIGDSQGDPVGFRNELVVEATHLKNMQTSKLAHFSPILGVKIKKNM